jgi:hypothetical protein
METLKKRLSGLQNTYSEMVEGIQNLEKDIISCQEFEALLKNRIESAKSEAQMCKQEIEMRKDVIKNLPILMAEVTKEMEQVSKTKFTEDDTILYNDWQERITLCFSVPLAPVPSARSMKCVKKIITLCFSKA